MEEHKKYFYTNGKPRSEYYYKDGNFHRENGPAQILYYDDGSKDTERYYIEGKVHREDGPALLFHHKNGNICKEYYYLNGVEYTDKDITDNWKLFCRMQIFR